MFKKIIYLLLLTSLSPIAYAQDLYDDFDKLMDKSVYDTFLPVYTQHTGTLGIYTNGWGFMYEYGFEKNPKIKNIISLEFSVLKDPKERSNTFRASINNQIRTFSYIYAKQHIAYPLKLSGGQQFRIGTPNTYRGVRADLFYKVGIILALVRPYYLTVRKDARITEDNQTIQNFEDIKFSSQDSLLFLDPTQIIRYSGFSSGWSETKVQPGFTINIGGRLNFAPAARGKNGIVGIEIGLSLDQYIKPIALLVPLSNVNNKSFFVQGRINFYFGGYSKHPSRIKIPTLN